MYYLFFIIFENRDVIKAVININSSPINNHKRLTTDIDVASTSAPDLEEDALRSEYSTISSSTSHLLESSRITRFDKNGKSKTIISTNNQGGFLRTLNADGKETVYLGTMHEGYGALGTFNADGKHTAYLGDGNLQTYNKHGVKVGYFGAGKSGDGIILLNDRYGDDGWDESGKQ